MNRFTLLLILSLLAAPTIANATAASSAAGSADPAVPATSTTPAQSASTPPPSTPTPKPPASIAPPPISIDIDLAAQKAFLLQEGKIVYETPICSGRPGHLTPTGNFQVLDKDENHLSSIYGKIVDPNGNTVVPNADIDMPVPHGAHFVQAPMRHFLRFDGANGLHEGYLPGYPASHGCVRLPPAKAALFFDIVPVGAPVHVHGKPPATAPPEAKPKKAPAATPAPTPTPAPRKWYDVFRKTS